MQVKAQAKVKVSALPVQGTSATALLFDAIDSQVLVVQAAEPLAEVSDHVLGLTIFPEGKRLLVQTVRELKVLEIASRKIAGFEPGPLRDAEFNGALLGPIRDGCAGPGSDEITFSAQTRDRAGTTRRRIYAIHLDGTAVRGLTPIDSGAVAWFLFPNTGTSAYDLSKKWILDEIKYADAHR